MSFKYNIGDIFKFGIMEDVIMDREVINGVNIYTLETNTGIRYQENEDQLDKYKVRTNYISYIPQFNPWDSTYDISDVPPRRVQEARCSCSSKQLFNFGCNCGYLKDKK